MRRNKHSLSHYRLATLNMGQIMPIGCLEVLPGDTFRHGTSALIRVSPLVAPVMHPVHVKVHHWFVPSRILWSNFEPFITGQNTSLQVPVVDLNGDAGAIALAQALGVGVDAGSSIDINALPLRAYNKIFNEFYRDQDLVSALTEASGDTDDATNYDIAYAAWEKDYFTTARPYAQQGEDVETVGVTFGDTQAPVSGIAFTGTVTPLTDGITFRETAGDTTEGFWKDTDAANITYIRSAGTIASSAPDVYADLSGISSGTVDINDLRTALALQRIREARSRYGSRYRDMLAFMGIRSSDARLQRPEYLGGGKSTIAFSEVLSTAEVPSGSTLGQLGGHGIVAMRSRMYKRFFEEHGYVISLMVVRPKTIYQNQVPRTFLRRNYQDFWQRELELQGAQPVTKLELDAAAGGEAAEIFGYVPRFDDYRHQPSFVAGAFRTDPFDDWHFARQFSSTPTLNAAFVTASDVATRAFASPSSEQLQAMISHQVMARRLVSRRGKG